MAEKFVAIRRGDPWVEAPIQPRSWISCYREWLGLCLYSAAVAPFQSSHESCLSAAIATIISRNNITR
jgi:hypothetical protein